MIKAQTVSDRQPSDDSAHLVALQSSVSTALSFGLAVLEQGAPGNLDIPLPLLWQARLAAGDGTSIDTIVRRYLAGHVLLNDFLLQELVGGSEFDMGQAHLFIREQGEAMEQLLKVLRDEYEVEARRLARSTTNRQAESIRRLLAGGSPGTAEFAYDFDVWHVGVIAVGWVSGETLHGLAEKLDSRLLFARSAANVTWAWLGRMEKPRPPALQEMVNEWPGDVSVAIGSPSDGLAGWRLTHQQATAALPVLNRRAEKVGFYADVALLASFSRDPLLSVSLQEIYLAPLDEERDGGLRLRATLRAYLSADRNVSSAAAHLGVNRRTVFNHLRSVEEKIGCPVNCVAAEIEIALRFEELTALDGSNSSSAHIGKSITAPFPT